MPNTPSSNMTSKRYCPKCGSFNLKKIKRGYFQKTILKQPMQFKCGECDESLSEPDFIDNEAKEAPVFIAK